MAQTDERSSSSMPRLLIVAAGVLLVLRLGADLVAMARGPLAATPVAWTRADSCDTLPPQSDKPVIYQFYAEWSDACKLMDGAALGNGEVRNLIQNKFTAVRIYDAPKGKNPQWVNELEKRYRIFVLPTLVVVKPDGSQECSLIGNCSSFTTYRFLSRALSKHGSR